MKKWTVLIMLAVAQFIMILDSSVMNVSISQVAESLGTTITGMQAAITLYALTMAAFMMTGAKLGDIWGRKRTFIIGSAIYAIGSFLTAISGSLPMLLTGWSLIEGLGAILVIPAIAALTAINYTGKDRITAFSILGVATGLAAALGPIIGGAVTTYLSWRYVFLAETVIMVILIMLSGKIADAKATSKPKLDILSVIMSASGMALAILGVLISKTYGWIQPLKIPIVNGVEIAPFGISIVAYMILAGILILILFGRRQRKLMDAGKSPLLDTSMLKIPVLKSGLASFSAQYFTIAAIFFVIPVYLQTILGYDALETGIKILPLSFGLVLMSPIGSRLSATVPAKRIVSSGKVLMFIGTVGMLGSIDLEMKSVLFFISMFIVGAGFGLLASQLGNLNMSSVDKSKSSEVGGLQGTFQNIGTSLGVAIAGSIFVLNLTSGFINSVNSSDLPDSVKTQVSNVSDTGLGIYTNDQAYDIALEGTGSEQDAEELTSIYRDSQVQGLQTALFSIAAVTLLSLLFSRNLPNKVPKESQKIVT